MKAFPVKVDENLGAIHVQLLRREGYAADSVRDERLAGSPDEAVWLRVQDDDRFFVTLDLDFSDVRRFPPGSHAGILLLRPRTAGPGAALSLLRRVLGERRLDALKGCLVVADEQRTRIRWPRRWP